ncbi:MAG: hypothetical protein CFE28_14765 [Alphaproteobacteria bacterium PA2]|nr:MAG: hypothetical protein CFE28_14765 [Alphaproteobacteria bacterium PA2]
MVSNSLRGLLGLAAIFGLAGPVFAQTPSSNLGQQVYERACAGCHAAPAAGSRASSVEQLRLMTAQTLRTALTTGPMRGVGESLSPEEMEGVIGYLSNRSAPASAGIPAPPMCSSDRLSIRIPQGVATRGWGFDPENTRRMSASQAGLTSGNLKNLEVAWTLAFPGTTTLRSQGVVVGSTLFYSAGQAGRLYALDAETGCAKWIAEPPSEIRTGLAFGRLGKTGRFALVGSDGGGQVQAWDATTGKLIWRVDPRTGGIGMLTGTPAFAGEKLIVPISAIDVALAMRPTYGCCKGHGAVAALSAETGARLWTYHTMVDAAPLGIKNSQGVEMQGPSGAPIWSSPAIDMKRGLVFVGTGENTSPPATATSDSIIAIDLKTGHAKWVFQALANDVWNMSCPQGRGSRRPPGANCFFYESDSVLRDHDFGAGPVIASAGGKPMILAGQKSGDVWGLDARTGEKIWNQKLGIGTALGGVHWGLTADARRLYAPISDPGVPQEKSAAGVHALDPSTGKVLWSWRVQPACDPPRGAKVAGCMAHAGISAAPMVLDQSIVAGGLDGRVWVLDAATGAVQAVHDTIATFDGINGVKGNGGAIDSAGIFAGGGSLFVNSGYSQFGQQGGNVLIAYRSRR